MKPADKKLTGTRTNPAPSNRRPEHAPRAKPSAIQPKTVVSAQSVKRPVAPPAFRPRATPKTVQPKMTDGAVNRGPRAAPPVYHPQKAPKVLQAKEAKPCPAHPSGAGRKRPTSPPACRTQSVPKVLQRKTTNPPGLAAPRPPASAMGGRKFPSMSPQSRAAQGTIQRAASSASAGAKAVVDWEEVAGKFLMGMDAEADAIRKAKQAEAAKAQHQKASVKAPAAAASAAPAAAASASAAAAVHAPVIAAPSDPPTDADIIRLAAAGLLKVGPPTNMNTISFDPDESGGGVYDQNYSYTLSYSGKIIAYLHAHYNTNDKAKVSTVKAKFNVKSVAAHATKARGGYIMDDAPASLGAAARALPH